KRSKRFPAFVRRRLTGAGREVLVGAAHRAEPAAVLPAKGLQGNLELYLLLDEGVEGDDEVVVVQDVELLRTELEAVVRVALVRVRRTLAFPGLFVRRREDPGCLARAAERDGSKTTRARRDAVEYDAAIQNETRLVTLETTGERHGRERHELGPCEASGRKVELMRKINGLVESRFEVQIHGERLLLHEEEPRNITWKHAYRRRRAPAGGASVRRWPLSGRAAFGMARRAPGRCVHPPLAAAGPRARTPRRARGGCLVPRAPRHDLVTDRCRTRRPPCRGRRFLREPGHSASGRLAARRRDRARPHAAPPPRMALAKEPSRLH